ncbi:MAG: recombinase family protein [Oscillospiraceae bacterium]|nr:recombinase family protein [Oscillospiraceae bacterium]
MVSRIENGEVSTLILKDSSRMARNYLQAGLYRQMFQEKGVRLICINDGTDTALKEDDFLPFREIMAEWHARDTSRKIKSVITAKGKSGKPTSNIAIYGFIKDPDDKNRWLIDEPAAAVVRRIFQMTMDGIGPYEIARTLTEEKVERPSYYLGSRGRGKHKNSYDGEHPYTWWCSTITHILSMPEYCGHTVNFRTRRENFKSKKATQIPAEEWLIFENAHDAIISQEVFDTVQKLRGTPRRIDRFGDANPLTGLLWCKDCGAKMYNHRKTKPTLHKNGNGKTYEERPQDIYQCSAWKLNKTKFAAKCSAHHIQTKAVREIILEVLRKTAGYVRDHEDEFVELVRASSAVKQGETAKSYKKQIAKNEKRVAELSKVFRSLYEDKALCKLSEERFEEMTAGYEQEEADLKAQTDRLQSELDAFNSDSVRADKFIELVRRYTRFEELTNAMINEFIERVEIHEGVWSESGGQYKGTRRQDVDVYLKYVGKFIAPDMRSQEEIEAERIAEEKAERERTRRRENARKRTEEKREAEAVPAPPKPAA